MIIQHDIPVAFSYMTAAIPEFFRFHIQNHASGVVVFVVDDVNRVVYLGAGYAGTERFQAFLDGALRRPQAERISDRRNGRRLCLQGIGDRHIQDDFRDSGDKPFAVRGKVGMYVYSQYVQLTQNN